MTNAAQRYIDQVMSRVFAPEEGRERLRADLEGHFRDAEEANEPAASVIARLGSAEEVAASFMEEVQLTPAGFWERLVAFIGDIGLLGLVFFPFFPICILLGSLAEESDGALGIGIVLILVMAGLSFFALAIFYFPLLEHFYGKTFGKKALHLRVLSETGAPVGLGAAFLRRLSFFLEILWVDALFIPFTEKKQRAFDMVAKTLVVREPGTQSGPLGWLLCLAPWLVIAVLAVPMVFIFGG